MNIKTRLLPAALIVVLTVGLSILSRPTRVLFFAALAIASVFELRTVLDEAGVKLDAPILCGYLAGHIVLCMTGLPAVWMIALYAIAAFAVMLLGILKPESERDKVIGTLFALTWPFGFYAIILHAAASAVWLPVLALGILSAWACDCMALIGGKFFGRHKLSPQVSPNKTWEGAIIGAAFSVLAGYLIHLLIRPYYPLPALVCMVIALIASTFGQLGDLAASLIKRMAGVKDYGHLLPEHGGVMDKMDSMLFAIPAAYILLHIASLL